MTALDIFVAKTGALVGAGQAYQRLAYADESGVFGADADVEYDGESGRVRVTVTEWEKGPTGTDRSPAMRVEFDAATGHVIGDDTEALASLLVAVDGMRVLGSGEGA